jgi:hypothetical protein
MEVKWVEHSFDSSHRVTPIVVIACDYYATIKSSKFIKTLQNRHQYSHYLDYNIVIFDTYSSQIKYESKR